MHGTLVEDASEAVSKRNLIQPHDAAKRRMFELEHGGAFRSDWLRVLMIHLEVDRGELQKHTPFDIDLFSGRAFVSLVAFEMRRFRPRGTGILGSWAFAPATHHRLFNVRTYVHHNGEPGICFLTEWVPNPLSALLGPRLFGLPYWLGRLSSVYDHDGCACHGCVHSPGARLSCSYRARWTSGSRDGVAKSGSLAEFLLERYSAFTLCCGRRRYFRIWHEPWRFQEAEVELKERSLLGVTGEWLLKAKVAGGHFSQGVHNVWIGLPHQA